MFNKSFLGMCYTGKVQERFIEGAFKMALAFGLTLPVIFTLLTLLKIFPRFMSNCTLIEIGGMFPHLFAQTLPDVKLFTTLLALLSLPPVIMAVLFKLTKLPLFVLLMIIDLILGAVRTAQALAANPQVTEVMPALPYIALFLFIALFAAYLRGLIGSTMLTFNWFEYKKHSEYLKAHPLAEVSTPSNID